MAKSFEEQIRDAELERLKTQIAKNLTIQEKAVEEATEILKQSKFQDG